MFYSDSNPAMRIAMIGQKGMPASFGGVERHVHDLAVSLAGLNHQVTVYGRSWYTGKKGSIVIDGVQVAHTPTLHTKHLDAITHTFFSTIHALFQGYDVIHYHGVGPALLSWIPRLFSRKAIVVTTFHSIDRTHQKWGTFAKWVLRLGEKAAVKFAHYTITVSRSLEWYCQKEFNLSTVYIPNGVNPLTKTKSLAILKKLGLEPNQYLVMVSRLVPHKGAHFLIKAFSEFKEKNPHLSKLKLVIVGGSVHTDTYVNELHAMAGSDVVLAGFQTGIDIQSLYQNAIALVHPSLSEGLPITVLEAMNNGKPVLLSDIPEHLEIGTDSRLVFKRGNHNSIVASLTKFFALTQAEQDQIGEANAFIIETHYHWAHLVPQILAVYTGQVSVTPETILATV